MSKLLSFLMPLLAWLVFAWFPLQSVSQTGENDQETAKKMPMEVLVTDMENNPRQGEEIIFIDTLSKQRYSGVTNANGTFDIELPGGRTYITKIKGVGDLMKYRSFSIPELQKNQMFSKSQFLIKYDPPKVYTLDHVYFDVNKASLRKASFSELDKLVSYLERRKHIRVEIAGHTDNVGSKEANQKLSERRAKRVRQYLLKNGISPDRVEAKGYGEERPVAGNNSKEGRQKNRRTEVHILGPSSH